MASRMSAWAKGFAGRAVFSRRGSVAIVIGITLPVMLGMIGLGTEVTFLIYQRRQMQTAADAAALGAATALTKGYPAYATEANATAAALGFVNGASNVTVTVNKPPRSGSYTTSASAIEVLISQPQTMTIASYFTSASFTVSARAVALQGTSGTFCVLSTDTSAATAVSISNGANVLMNSCSLGVNATGSAALSVTGAASLKALSVSVSGQVSITNGGAITAPGGISLNQPAVTDPYASVAMPVSAGCLYSGLQIGWAATTQVLSPGTYCNGLSIGNGAIVSFSPGIYYIKSGSLSIGGGTTVTGTGVTIVLTNNTSSYATVTISNGAVVSFTAPTSGATAGIVFFGDRNAPGSNTNSFIGGTSNSYTGALYFPSQTVSFSNGATTSSPCTQLIAWHIQLSGGTSFNSTCAGTGVSAIGAGSQSQLAE